MRRCKKCKLEKENKDFHKHPSGKEGLCPYCKDCEKIRRREKYLKNRLNPEWVKNQRKKSRDYYSKNKDKINLTPRNNKKYNSDYPEKQKAVSLARTIEVPNGFEKHHWSYNDEHHKDIIPLSVKDHNQLHRFIIYDQEIFMYRVKVAFNNFNVNDILNTKKLHINYYLQLKMSELWE